MYHFPKRTKYQFLQTTADVSSKLINKDLEYMNAKLRELNPRTAQISVDYLLKHDDLFNQLDKLELFKKDDKNINRIKNISDKLKAHELVHNELVTVVENFILFYRDSIKLNLVVLKDKFSRIGNSRVCWGKTFDLPELELLGPFSVAMLENGKQVVWDNLFDDDLRTRMYKNIYNFDINNSLLSVGKGKADEYEAKLLERHINEMGYSIQKIHDVTTRFKASYKELFNS